MKNDKQLSNSVRFVAIVGNLVFIAWLLVNGINERFSGLRPVELASMIGLLLLLTLNVIILFCQK